jgi:hypothetical protein
MVSCDGDVTAKSGTKLNKLAAPMAAINLHAFMLKESHFRGQMRFCSSTESMETSLSARSNQRHVPKANLKRIFLDELSGWVPAHPFKFRSLRPIVPRAGRVQRHS